MGTKRFRPGKALIELAMGLFALSLVSAVLFGFSAYIVRSLDALRQVRAEAGSRAFASADPEGSATASASASVTLDRLLAKFVTGTRCLRIDEEVTLPSLGELE